MRGAARADAIRSKTALGGSEPCGNGFCHGFATYHGETASYNDERHGGGGGDGEVEQPGTRLQIGSMRGLPLAQKTSGMILNG